MLLLNCSLPKRRPRIQWRSFSRAPRRPGATISMRSRTCSTHALSGFLLWLRFFESIREVDRENCTACQTDDGARTGSFETPQTNTIHPFAWDHGECDAPNPMRVASNAANLTPAVRWHRQASWGGIQVRDTGSSPLTSPCSRPMSLSVSTSPIS